MVCSSVSWCSRDVGGKKNREKEIKVVNDDRFLMIQHAVINRMNRQGVRAVSEENGVEECLCQRVMLEGGFDVAKNSKFFFNLSI